MSGTKNFLKNNAYITNAFLLIPESFENVAQDQDSHNKFADPQQDWPVCLCFWG